MTHSENYVVKWSKEGVPKDLDMLNNFKVIFTVSFFKVYMVYCSFYPSYVSYCIIEHWLNPFKSCIISQLIEINSVIQV